MRPVLLVANRGEIACRILRSARSLGVRTVAVFSDADAHAPHVALADEAVRVGPAAVGQSYLDAQAVIAAAQRAGATHVHPGYGFLSEDASFAAAVTEAGLTWVGPPSRAIDAMGDKARAKEAMRAAGVPVVPGAEGEPDDLLAAADEVGFPLLVKASAGGGGRGIRRVDEVSALPAALSRAAAEAQASFGSSGLLLERLVERARHVEIQVMADAHGTVIHLGERDCSTQRRHQKVIEEAPSPAVSAELRAAMGQAACSAARAVGYVGAGTVELLLGADGSFYFLEMNTRLQVEHPVTEQITGLDLVALQLRVALGEPLGLTQSDVTLTGHAIEARLYAEDPAADFAPRTGPLVAFRAPDGRDGVRIDAGVQAGQAITPHYDPMIAKVITWGPDRETARRRLDAALADTVVLGVGTNRRFLRRVLVDPVFVAGEVTTDFLEARADLLPEAPLDAQTPVVAAALTVCRFGALTGFRSAHPASQPVVLSVDGQRVALSLAGASEGVLSIVSEGRTHAVSVGAESPELGGVCTVRIDVDGVVRSAQVARRGESMWLQHRADAVQVAPWDPTPSLAAQASGDGTLRAASAGRVLEVTASVGQAVEVGDVLVVVEAMKIETRVRADVAGTLVELAVQAGQSVGTGEVLARIEPTSSPASETPS